MTMIRKIFRRFVRIITGQKGVWCKKGKKNHISEGTILYEPCIIGNYNYFAPYTLVYNAVIGNYCSIGPGCRIGLADHDIHAISTRSCINNGNGGMNLFDYNNPSRIGNDVWLGTNVVVKQGVNIGNGAVVGANAVVLEDIPPYSVAVGVPAKVKSYRFSEGQREILLKSNWYEEEIKDAQKIVGQLFEEILEERI